MSQLSLLLGYCAAMFMGAYVSGWVTTAIQGRHARLNRMLAIFGAGLLVGTALIVIIPEGVSMYYEAIKLEAAAPHLASSVPPGVRVVPRTLDGQVRALQNNSPSGGMHSTARLGALSLEGSGLAERAHELVRALRAVAVPDVDDNEQGVAGEEEEEEAAEAEAGTGDGTDDGAAADTIGTGGGTDGVDDGIQEEVTAAASSQEAAGEAEREEEEGEEEAGHSHAAHAHGSTHSAEQAPEASAGAASQPAHDHDHASEGGAAHSHSHGGPAIGAALVLGFAFQLVVDRLAGGLHAHSHGEGGHGHAHGATRGSRSLSRQAAAGGVSTESSDGSCGDDGSSEDGDEEAAAGASRRRGAGASSSRKPTRARGRSRQHREGDAAAPGAGRPGGVARAGSKSATGAGTHVPSSGSSALAIIGSGATADSRGDAAMVQPQAAAAEVLAQESQCDHHHDAAATHGGGSDAAVKGKGNSAFVGLIVHAAVDGVALGAAVAEGDASLGLIVFLAIMLHKAPSSFGLGSYLLLQGYSAAQVQARLAVFSSSAPLAALATYALLSANLFAYTRYSLALCLLFSGGTFLYVATAHILPEIQMQRQPSADASASGEGGEEEGKPNLSWGEVGVLVGGLLLPLLLNVQHGH